MASKDDDFVPVTGGIDLADDYLRDDLDLLLDVKVRSRLDRHILQLRALHIELRDRFQIQDLARMSNADKQRMLQEMNDLLGIRPLRTGNR